MRVVCISGQAGHGKSTAECALAGIGFRPVMLALPIKKLLVGLSNLLPSIFKDGRLSLEQCNDESTKATQLLTAEGVTNRFMMQQLGDVLKDAFGDNELFARTAAVHMTDEPTFDYVISDIRSIDELSMITKLLDATGKHEVLSLRVEAPSVGKVGSCASGDTAKHWSETKVVGVPYDMHITNPMDGEKRFQDAVIAAVNGYFRDATVV